MFQAALTDEHRQALSGFTFYPKATTPYGRTVMAMASIFANADYDYDQPVKEYRDSAFRCRRPT